MSVPTPDIIEARKWCIARALDVCKDIDALPALAAALIALLEAGRAPAPGAAAAPEDARPAPPAPPEIAFRRAVEEVAASDLSDKEQAVLDAIVTLVGEHSRFPTHAEMSAAGDIPVGSIGKMLERLHDKGYLARPDRQWAVADKAADGVAA